MTGRAVPVTGAVPGSAEIVLRRAIQLAGEGGPGPVELTAEHLREVAAELAIPSGAVTAALAEARVMAGLPPAGPLARLVGPVAVVGWRQVDADAARTEEVLVDWLEAGHVLRVRRWGDGTLVATRRPGLAGSVARTARSVGGGRDLAGRGEVRATVVADPGPGPDGRTGSVACVLVDVRRRRRRALGGGGAVGAVGLAASAVAGVAVAPPLLAVGVPLSVALGLASAAVAHRSTVRAVTEEVEVTLDAVSRRRPPGGRVRSAVRTMTRRHTPA